MKFVFFGFLILYFGSLIANPKCDQADLILEDASIYNGLSDNSFIGSIGIKDSKISFVEKDILEISIVEKFVGERGRINCSLKETDGFWRWLGIQFVISGK